MSSHFHIREEGRDNVVANVRGEMALTSNRNGGRPTINLDVQILGNIDGEEAVFWLRGLGPIQDDRLAIQCRLWDSDQGGFYCYEHRDLENMALVVFRVEQPKWRFIAVADLMSAAHNTQRLEIDLALAVVQRIEWVCG